MNAREQQVGGSHYKDMAIQPVEYIHRNGIPFIEGCVIKYVSRWRQKGGIQDLEKARHFLALLIEMESGQSSIWDDLIGHDVYVEWTDEDSDWHWFYLVSVEGARVTLQGVMSPDGDPHAGDTFTVNAQEIASMRAMP